MSSEYQNDNFEQLIAGLNNIVGTEEIEMREMKYVVGRGE